MARLGPDPLLSSRLWGQLERGRRPRGRSWCRLSYGTRLPLRRGRRRRRLGRRWRRLLRRRVLQRSRRRIRHHRLTTGGNPEVGVIADRRGRARTAVAGQDADIRLVLGIGSSRRRPQGDRPQSQSHTPAARPI